MRSVQHGSHALTTRLLLTLFALLIGLSAGYPAFADRSVADSGQPAQAQLTDRRGGRPLLASAWAGLAQAPDAAASYHAYLPLVTAAGTATETPVDGSFHYTTFLMPFRLNSALVMSKTPQVAADPQGGVHVVYTSNYPDNGERRPTYYGYCRAACNSQANFEVVALFDHAWFTQLAVDQAGHPRLLIATWPPESGFDPILHWIYAECNANCTSPAAWAHVDLGNGYWYGSDTQSKQTFVLDTHGHPRLIYYAARYNAMVDPSADMRFMYCDADCTNPDQWNTTILSNTGWYDPALVLTPSGLPRIAFNSIGDNQLNYVECDTPTCSAGTLNTILTNSSNTTYGGPSFSLKLDRQGRPRMAYYPGLTAGTLPGGRLYYLACDENCTATGTWRGGDIGMPTTNESGSTILQGAGGVALALDPQDHPRIAFRMGMGRNELGYAWCNAGCENEHTTWPYTVIWSSDAQLAEIGVPPAEGCPDCHPPIPPCPGGFWDAGFWPSLTLDAAGNPRIAYEVQLQHGGGQCDNATWAHMTRLAVFQQP